MKLNIEDMTGIMFTVIDIIEYDPIFFPIKKVDELDSVILIIMQYRDSYYLGIHSNTNTPWFEKYHKVVKFIKIQWYKPLIYAAIIYDKKIKKQDTHCFLDYIFLLEETELATILLQGLHR